MKNYLKKFSIMFVMSLILMLGCCVSAFAADVSKTLNFDKVIYVDVNNGSDTNGDGSQSIPYKTIDYATTKITTDNTLIYIGEGTYTVNKLSNMSLTNKTVTYIGKNEKTILEFSACGSSFLGNLNLNNCVLRPANNFGGDTRFLNYGTDVCTVNFNNCLFRKSANETYPTCFYLEFTSNGMRFTNKTCNNCTFEYVICKQYPNNEAYRAISSPYGQFNNCATATKYVNFGGARTSYDTTSFVNATYDTNFKLTNGDNSIYGVYSGANAWGNSFGNNQSISLNQTSISLTEGQTQQLTATTTPAGAEVVWSSSDESIAAVDSNGKVTTVKEGQATITAQIKGSETKATCVVNVSKDGGTTEPTQPTGDGNLFIELVDGNIKSYQVTASQIENFKQWYLDRDNTKSNKPYYQFDKGSYKDYVIHDKIDWFEVR